jgi:hypothetical protein
LRAASWPVTRPLTCDELWRVWEASVERLEIIDGELFATQDGRYRADQVMSDAAISATIPELSADLKALFAPVPGL